VLLSSYAAPGGRMHAAFASLSLTFAYGGGGGLEPEEEYIAPPQCHRLVVDDDKTRRRRRRRLSTSVVDVGRRGLWDVRSNAHSYLIPPASDDVLAIVDDAPFALTTPSRLDDS